LNAIETSNKHHRVCNKSFCLTNIKAVKFHIKPNVLDKTLKSHQQLQVSVNTVISPAHPHHPIQFHCRDTLFPQQQQKSYNFRMLAYITIHDDFCL
jgi:hypothetical protein